MSYFSVLVIGISVIVIAIFGCALAQAKVVQSSVEGMARQPAVSGKIQLAMIIGLAFVESLTIYSLMLSFILLGKLPPTQDVLEIFRQSPKQELLSSANEHIRSVVKN
ncbi:MAG: ATP synthase F0 subunit C [Candidatus Brocadia sp.]|nr:ATP synthase F0 subunit C [Candidatus Brocadia sp.]NUO07092.1 ATP synthase F0 subunit C [Candidatus Brocadia sp.]